MCKRAIEISQKTVVLKKRDDLRIHYKCMSMDVFKCKKKRIKQIAEVNSHVGIEFKLLRDRSFKVISQNKHFRRSKKKEKKNNKIKTYATKRNSNPKQLSAI